MLTITEKISCRIPIFSTLSPIDALIDRGVFVFRLIGLYVL